MATGIGGSIAKTDGSIPPSIAGMPPLLDLEGSRAGCPAPALLRARSPVAFFRPHRPARSSVERRAGRLLLEMREREVYRSLGYVRLGDYVIEGLGISYGSAQEMMRVDEALERLPHLAAAFETGEISSGHVRVLSRVASSESEPLWVGLARRMGVKALSRAVAAHAEGRPGLTDGGGGADNNDEAVEGGHEPGPGAAFTDPGCSGGVSLDTDRAASEELELERLEMVVPAWIAGFWRRSVELVRRLVGSTIPPGACFEMVLAEVADAVEPLDAEAGGLSDPGKVHASARPGSMDTNASSTVPALREVHTSARPSSIEAAGPSAGAADTGEVQSSACPDLMDTSASTPALASQEVHASARNAGENSRASSLDATPGGPAPDPELDARAMDRELRSLFTEKQRQDARLAEHLRLVALDRGYRDLGCASLEEYAADRFGLSHGGLYNLLALQRRLEALPALRAAFLCGRLMARQATLIGTVATVVGVEAWVRRAEGGVRGAGSWSELGRRPRV